MKFGSYSNIFLITCLYASGDPLNSEFAVRPTPEGFGLEVEAKIGLSSLTLQLLIHQCQKARDVSSS